MKILILVPDIFSKGGIQRYVRYQYQALVETYGESNIYIFFDGKVESLVGAFIRVSSDNLQNDIIIEIKNQELEDISLAIHNKIEFSLSLNLFSQSSTIGLHFEIEQNKKIVQSLPSYGTLEIELDRDYLKNWFI